MKQYKTIVVKVGTNVLTGEQGLLDHDHIKHLTDQLATLKKQNIKIILVSSGAVGAGKAVLPPATNELNKVVRRQVLSSVGQIQLMNLYTSNFSEHQIFCAQLLVTKEDFRDRIHYLNMKNCFLSLQREEIIPIVNENDVVSVSELMFTDNDELAGLIASMVNADALIILTNVDGIYDGHPEAATSQLITEIQPNDPGILAAISPTKSKFGRGGMLTKYRIASKAASVGIATVIANGKRQNILVDILNNDFVGTSFLPEQNVSNLKKWIAYNEPTNTVVIINEGAKQALCSSEKVSSLLPVGIVAINGNFKKGDLIKIADQNNQQIGLGIAQYNSEKATKFIGVQDKKPLIHYDYLFIEK